jgi:hypothetical protein
MASFVEEKNLVTATTPDIVSGLTCDGGSCLRVYDLHMGGMFLDIKPFRQKERRKFSQYYPHLFKDRVRVAETVNELFLPRSPSNGNPGLEQPLAN